MVKFILINPNEYFPNKLKELNNKKDDLDINENNLFKLKSNYIDIESFKDKIKNFIEFIDIDIETNWMNEIIKLLGLSHNNYCDIKDCYISKNHIYQLFHILPNQDDNLNDEPKNVFSSFLSYNKKLIFNKAILFKTKLSHDNIDANIEDITYRDMVSLVMNNYYHSGVHINAETKEIKQFFFNNNKEIIDPLNFFNKINDFSILKNSNFGIKNMNILNFNLDFIYNFESNENINEPFCMLLKGMVKGGGVILDKFDDDNYYDFSKETLINLLKCEKKLQLTENDMSKQFVKDNIAIVKTKYRILFNKLYNKEFKCVN